MRKDTVQPRHTQIHTHIVSVLPRMGRSTSAQMPQSSRPTTLCVSQNRGMKPACSAVSVEKERREGHVEVVEKAGRVVAFHSM